MSLSLIIAIISIFIILIMMPLIISNKSENDSKTLDEWKMNASGLCSNHESLAPLAKAFGIPFVALNLSDDMSKESLNAMVDALKKAKIKKIHPNEALSQTGLDELVKAALSQGWQLQVGAPVFSLNLDQTGSGVENYLEMMMFNLRSITEG